MKIDLGKILTRSWQIIWKHKVLWVFGIFAGFANGNGGSSNNGSSFNEGDPSSFIGDTASFPQQVSEFFQEYMLIIIAVCLALALLSFAFYALGMMGRIGILKGVYKLEAGAPSVIFAELWSESMPYFWRFFGMNFLVGLVVFILVIVIMVPSFLLGVATAGIGLLCLVPLICLLVPVGWAVNIILEQAQAAIVAEDLTMFDGFKRGWAIAKSDIIGMVVLSIILAIGAGVIGLVLAIPVFAAMVPLIFGFAGGFQPGDDLPATLWVSIICCGIYLPVLIGLNGVLTAYIKTAWALSYLQLAKPSENTPILAQADA